MEEETTFKKLKNGLIELLKGYPDYRFFGKIEYYLKNGQSSIKILERDRIIELASKEEEKLLNKTLTPEQLILLKKEGKKQPDCWYRLTSKGVDLAISTINLEHSERVLEHSKKMLKYTKTIRTLTWVMVGVSILTFFSIIFNIFCG